MLRLRTFGSVDLQGPDDRDLRSVLAQPKRLALLIYLAAARPSGVHRRDELLALFWPDLDDTRARDALNQALRFLRQAVGADVFVRRGGEDVGVDPAVLWCDATAFHDALEVGRPAEAMELYRGDFLQGFFIEESGGFEEWMERERAGFRESAARGARQIAEEHAAGGALTLAIDWGKRALELAPDDERALRRLLKLFDRAGDRAGAFRVYDVFVRRFEEEFGGEPSPETKALAERLKAGLPLAEERDAAAKPAVESPRPFARDPTAEIGDRYRIIRKLGAGGMATVYLALDVKHDREVALKVLKPEIAEGLARERFLREIRIAGQLQHPNIVPLFDSGVADGRLYFVMAHIQGETLRERLTREKRFEISEVVHLLREVAGALAYAHDRGVIHRDIKPENILLIDRRAVLADCGIARAAHAARTPAGTPDETLTMPGTSLGTPAYMSPEQAAGNPEIDHRADLYALGVLGYEMLAGRPPFVGSTGHQVLAAHLLEAPVPVDQLRPDTPAGLGALIMRCLEKQPSGRPESAQAFLAELEGGAPMARAARWWRQRAVRRGAMLVGGLLATALLGLMVNRAISRSVGRNGSGSAVAGGADASPDTSRYAILPFTRAASVPPNLPIEQFMQDAFARWEGISVVDRFQVNDAMSRRDTAHLTSEDAGLVATEVGAGRFVRGEASQIGDSLRIYAGLYDATRNNRLVVDRTVRLKASLAMADSAFATLADGLLFPSGSAGAHAEAGAGTRSLPALQAFSGAYGAIEEWNLARADSLFVRTTQLDAGFTEAFLWLAQVRMWRRLPLDQWSFAADRAVRGRGRLAPRDQALADALRLMVVGSLPAACATLLRLTRQEPYDFAAWYGMGTCFARDSLVIASPSSPSRWAFRTSYAQALRGYLRAFELLSSIRRSLKASAYEPVRRLLKTSSINPRLGYSGESPARPFLAYPSMEGDTLGFVPYPATDFQSGNQAIIPGTLGRALAEQRKVFHKVATGWVAQNPQSSDALEALAIATQMLGDPAALNILRRARTRASTPEDSLRLAGAEVWTRLMFSLPNDPTGVRETRLLADSLLALDPSIKARQPGLFVSLAVLLGRANLAARLTREPQVASAWGIPAALGQATAPLLVFSALGGPRDSIVELGARVRRLVASLPDAATRDEVVARFLVRSATLAGSEDGLLILDSAAATNDYLWSMQQAFRRNEWAAVRDSMARLRVMRKSLAMEDLAFDAVYPEALLLAGIGDTARASQWLDDVLLVLPRTPPQASPEPSVIGSLVRAMVLRAQIAARLGDRATAARWATSVELLWSGADSFLAAIVDSMRALTRVTDRTPH